MDVSEYDATYEPRDVIRFNAMVSSIRGGYEALCRNKRPEPGPYTEIARTRGRKLE